MSGYCIEVDFTVPKTLLTMGLNGAGTLAPCLNLFDKMLTLSSVRNLHGGLSEQLKMTPFVPLQVPVILANVTFVMDRLEVGDGQFAAPIAFLSQ